MAMLGKEIRMSRLVNPVSNKMMAITVDHATSRGIAPMTGIQDVQSAIDKIILGKPDAMTMTKGIAERCMYQHAGKVSILMKISNYSPVAPTKDTIFGTVDEAIRMGADAVSMGCMTLGDFQGEQFEAIGRVAEECMRKGMPLIGHVYPKGESVPADCGTRQGQFVENLGLRTHVYARDVARRSFQVHHLYAWRRRSGRNVAKGRLHQHPRYGSPKRRTRCNG